MAVFYVLPARAALGRHTSTLLANLFPGLSWSTEEWPELAELLRHAAEDRAGAYVVFRDEVADDLPLWQALVRDFGAAPCDAVIEVAIGADLTETRAGRWFVPLSARAA